LGPTLSDELPGGSSIAFDTNALIYYVEEHEKYLSVIEPVIDRVVDGALRAHASVITFTEVLVVPIRERALGVAARHRELPTLGIEIHGLDVNLEDAAATLGATYGLRTPDAIVCATALQAGCRFLITNDAAVRRVEGLRVLIIDDYV
jgi:predicted nucleic acid-binding protein